MFETFSHYLSYGATDQETARELTGSYSGLLVPGTVAAFQADGTKGFVLTLSATAQPPRYAIDPRFPLFQQPLPGAKRSHISLANLLGCPDLVDPVQAMQPDDYDDDLVRNIAASWLRFNSGFTELESKRFDKYAARLHEEVVPTDRKGPTFVIPPYVIALDEDGPDWWSLSKRLWEASVEQATEQSLVRVVATDDPGRLLDLVSQCPESRLAIWVSELSELDTTPSGTRNLTDYAGAVRQAASAGKRLFALYGGAFSVLLGLVGLNGSSHGIGYGEARSWQELPQSGPPPVRYYLPRAHRYVSQDLAILLYQERRDLAVCDCQECQGQNPARLTYHGLMRHSVRCRAREIESWVGSSIPDVCGDLRSDAEALARGIESMNVPRRLQRQADDCYKHLDSWASVLEQV